MYQRLHQDIMLIKRYRYQFLILVLRYTNRSKLIEFLTQLKIPTINVNLELARRLKDVPSSKRPRQAKDELKAIVDCYEQEVVFLKRIQYLFDEELKQDPLGLIRSISGNKTILVEWPGEVENGLLRYGTPDHPEYYERDGYQEHIIEL